MSDAAKPVYFANPTLDPVPIRIEGRASFQNSACLQDFIKALLAQGKPRFILDFAGCTSMDSTFLGVLAGVALQLRKLSPPGQLTLVRMSARNLELVRNLGLHRLLTVDTSQAPASDLGGQGTSIPCEQRSELESAKLVLNAHENLVSVDEANRSKFQDVLSFLRKRVDEGGV
ncbi:MAG TPA: STAS domain-containing protein [Opitutaceae bacterium]|nr:STAS domain-containing protein [Opitutaceae bacterium]